jgi:primosomal protein N' (replication factor Y) (superfamily II helicase)
MNRVRVILLNQAVGPFDYKLPDGVSAPPGSIVVVPLGPRRILGVVWDAHIFPVDPIEAKRLRAIYEVVDSPALRPELRRLVDWVADYYLSNHASVLRMVLSSSAAILSGAGTVTEYRATGHIPARMTALRAAALDQLDGAQGLARELAAEAGVSDAVIDKGGSV